MILTKLLDEEENNRELQTRLSGGNGKSLFPKQAKRFRWSEWRFKSGVELRDFVRNEVFPYMASLVKEEPQIAEYFRDAILEIVDPNVLKQVVDELDSIDFRKIGTDVKGDIFEYLLTHLYGEEWLDKATEVQKKFPTLQTYKKGVGEKIPDWSLLERSIYGVDVSRQMVRIAMMNMVLHGIQHARVKRANTLSEHGGLTEEDLRRRYKVVLSNPPFAGVLPKDSIRKDLSTNSKKSELLFLGVMMESLARGGRCAVVVPEGLLFGSTTAHVDLRRKLVEVFELLAVVSLPAGVFKPYAGVKTAVLIFRKPLSPDAKKVNKIWFYEVRADGYDPDKIVGGGRPETLERNDIPDLLRQWKEYKESGFRKIPGVEAGALLEPGSEEPRCWWASRKTVVQNDFNITAGRYKPQIAEKAPEEDPDQLIREVIGIEREIIRGLEKLLNEIETTE